MKPLKRNYSEPELELVKLSFQKVLESSDPLPTDENEIPFEPEK